MKKMLAVAALTFVSNLALAQTSPVGLWKTIDDDGKTEKSWVRISEAGGTFSATIEKILDPNKRDAKCDKCNDDRKDQPILGMSILRNLKKSSGDADLWDGGEILNPDEGKVYKVRMRPVEGGKRLEVRGYIGMPMFGRSQTWLRVE